ncbi:MAG: SUF system NifU family Fe-S cluster assembly protein [Elusimicrobia bacterium]|nr:SUF system NifU family Fe-S cluster assembly protein [Elusimicrobiota bacterium]
MPEGDAELADLYRDVLIDYYRSPSHKGKLETPDFHSHGVNPLCGDEVELTMTKDGEKIGQVRYAGHGCVISQASTVMMAEALEGAEFGRAKVLIENFRDMLLRNAPISGLPEELEEAKALEGVRKFPVRIKCALLAWNTMKLGLDQGPRKAETAEYKESER